MVLLIVDTQKLITNHKLYNFNIFVENIKLLIKKARENNIEVIYIRHDYGTGKPLTKGSIGFEIYDEFKPNHKEKVFDKTVNSPFKETELLEYLKQSNEKDLIVVGLQTDYCINATIKCGFEHGFNIFVPEYSNTTFDNDFMTAENTYKYYNNFIWNGRYAKCLSIEETINIIKGGFLKC